MLTSKMPTMTEFKVNVDISKQGKLRAEIAFVNASLTYEAVDQVPQEEQLKVLVSHMLSFIEGRLPKFSEYDDIKQYLNRLLGLIQEAEVPPATRKRMVVR
jgi:hypothetical protein